MRFSGIRLSAFLVLPLLFAIAGCARDGNHKEAAYEAIRAAYNVQQTGIGEEKTNEWSYREYEQKRAEAMREDERRDSEQPPEWLIDPSR